MVGLNGFTLIVTGFPRSGTSMMMRMLRGGGGIMSELNYGWVSPEGTIDVDSTVDTNATNSATQSVELYYIPLDAGATVVAI